MPSYIHGHQPSVLRSHTWRTAQNSSAYLLPYLEDALKNTPNLKVLDVGSGPGTITCDLAKLYPSIKITGIDRSSAIVAQATALAAEKGLSNVDFAEGDIFNLAYPDNTFDIIHVHQVLQHIPEPTKAVAELRRVLKPGGILAVRETDWPGAVWYPSSPAMVAFLEAYQNVAIWTGGTPDTGRRLLAMARAGGFPRENIKTSSSTWCYSSPEERVWWSSLWAERVESSDFRKNALESKLVTEEDLESFAKAWRDWGQDIDGWHSLLHGEVICFK